MSKAIYTKVGSVCLSRLFIKTEAPNLCLVPTFLESSRLRSLAACQSSTPETDLYLAVQDGSRLDKSLAWHICVDQLHVVPEYDICQHHLDCTRCIEPARAVRTVIVSSFLRHSRTLAQLPKTTYHIRFPSPQKGYFGLPSVYLDCPESAPFSELVLSLLTNLCMLKCEGSGYRTGSRRMARNGTANQFPFGT
jgi:hypothetical protein